MVAAVSVKSSAGSLSVVVGDVETADLVLVVVDLGTGLTCRCDLCGGRYGGFLFLYILIQIIVTAAKHHKEACADRDQLAG